MAELLCGGSSAVKDDEGLSVVKLRRDYHRLRKLPVRDLLGDNGVFYLRQDGQGGRGPSRLRIHLNGFLTVTSSLSIFIVFASLYHGNLLNPGRQSNDLPRLTYDVYGAMKFL